MIYFIYSKQTPFIKEKISSIAKERLKDYGIDEFNFVRMDAGNVLVQEVINECNFFSLACPYKVVSLEKCYFLLEQKSKNKRDQEQDFKSFLEYLKSPNPDCDLIISVDSLQIDKKQNDLVKYILNDQNIEKIEIAELNDSQWNNYVKQCVSKANLKIDFDALSELSSRTENDVILLQNTIEKLSLYSDRIKYKDILLLVNKPLEENTFVLFNLIINKRLGDALKLYRSLKDSSNEPVTIISMLTKQFLLLDEVFHLLKKGKDKELIAKELSIKPGRVYILSKEINKVKQEKIHSIIESLFQLDLQIKNGQIDRFCAFEMFLIKTNAILK